MCASVWDCGCLCASGWVCASVWVGVCLCASGCVGGCVSVETKGPLIGLWFEPKSKAK